jgi:elongation factor G
MKREFGVEANVGKPQVAYRETVTREARYDYTHKKQTGGSGQYAKVVGRMSPLPPGTVEPYAFVDNIKGGNIPREYIPGVDKGFKEAILKGSLIGAPVVGVRMDLDDGSYHDVDSSEMAFKIASIQAFRQAYANAGPVALEPLMKLEVNAPEEYQGSVMGQINQRRGMITGTMSNDNFVTVEAEVPLSEMFGYSTDLRSATQGKGEFTMEFSRYNACPRNVQEDLVKEYQKKREAEQKG